MNTTSNGLKLMEKIVVLGKSRPIVAIVLALIVLALFTGGGSFLASIFGQDLKLEKAVAELKRDLEFTDRFLKSAIKQETKDRIEEQVRLKEDGKLLSEAFIRNIIFEELRKSEDRIVARLRSN